MRLVCCAIWLALMSLFTKKREMLFLLLFDLVKIWLEHFHRALSARWMEKKRADAEISWLGFLSFISGEVCPVMYYLNLYVLSLVYSTRTTHHRSETSDVWNQIARDTLQLQQQQLEARYIAKQMARGSWENIRRRETVTDGPLCPSFPFFFIDSAWLLFSFYLYSSNLSRTHPVLSNRLLLG